jgi:hypothetical protein
VPEKPRRDLAATAGDELEFTDDKVRVGLMFSLLDNFVEWGKGGGVQERAVVILIISRMLMPRASARGMHPDLILRQGKSEEPPTRREGGCCQSRVH